MPAKMTLTRTCDAERCWEKMAVNVYFDMLKEHLCQSFVLGFFETYHSGLFVDDKG